MTSGCSISSFSLIHPKTVTSHTIVSGSAISGSTILERVPAMLSNLLPKKISGLEDSSLLARQIDPLPMWGVVLSVRYRASNECILELWRSRISQVVYRIRTSSRTRRTPPILEYTFVLVGQNSRTSNIISQQVLFCQHGTRKVRREIVGQSGTNITPCPWLVTLPCNISKPHCSLPDPDPFVTDICLFVRLGHRAITSNGWKGA